VPVVNPCPCQRHPITTNYARRDLCSQDHLDWDGKKTYPETGPTPMPNKDAGITSEPKTDLGLDLKSDLGMGLHWGPKPSSLYPMGLWIGPKSGMQPKTSNPFQNFLQCPIHLRFHLHEMSLQHPKKAVQLPLPIEPAIPFV
jgi:hypothetical protein